MPPSASAWLPRSPPWRGRPASRPGVRCSRSRSWRRCARCRATASSRSRRQQHAYDNRPLPIGDGQTISQPYIVALMTELLDPKPGHVVLEVGTGSGYQAAVLAEIVATVYTIEIVDALGRKAAATLSALGYRNVTTRIGDGYNGWKEHAPFDGILVTAAPAEVPQPLIDQLKPGGRLVIPGRWPVRRAGPAGDREEGRRLDDDAPHDPGAVRAADARAASDARLLAEQAVLRPSGTRGSRRIPRRPRQGARSLSAEARGPARGGRGGRHGAGPTRQSLPAALLFRCHRQVRGMVSRADPQDPARCSEARAPVASLVGVFASSHAPLMARAWEAVDAVRRDAISRTFSELARRVVEAKPDVLIVVSPDHWVNFFLNNLPSVCIGVGETHKGPPEPWLQHLPYASIAGHPEFALHLARTALDEGFEPSLSHHLELDHGFVIPLWKMGIDPLPPLVPIIVNTIEPPMPSLRRCLAWGDLIRAAIERHPGDLRVAVLATGGASHSIGEHDMGRIDEAFDRECFEQFRSADREGLARVSRSAPRCGRQRRGRNAQLARGPRCRAGKGIRTARLPSVPRVVRRLRIRSLESERTLNQRETAARNYSLWLAISEMLSSKISASFFSRRTAAARAFDVLENGSALPACCPLRQNSSR